MYNVHSNLIAKSEVSCAISWTSKCFSCLHSRASLQILPSTIDILLSKNLSFLAHNVIKYFLLKALQKLKLILVAWTERETSVVRVADPQIIYGPYFPSVWKDYKYAFFISQGNSSILSIPLWLLYRENIWWKQEYSCKKDFIPTCFSNQLLLVPENSHCR